MANICFTTVFIEGKRDKLQEFVDYYCEIENKLVEKENAIPAVLKGLKLNTKNIDFRRVKVDEMYIECENTLYVLMESAWEPKVKWLDAAIKQFDPDAKLYFYGEEPCCDVFISNDKENKYFSPYKIDAYIDDGYKVSDSELKRFNLFIGEDDKFVTKSEAETCLNLFLETKDLPLEKLEKILEEKYSDGENGIYINIYTIEYLDLDSIYLA